MLLSGRSGLRHGVLARDLDAAGVPDPRAGTGTITQCKQAAAEHRPIGELEHERLVRAQALAAAIADGDRIRHERRGLA